MMNYEFELRREIGRRRWYHCRESSWLSGGICSQEGNDDIDLFNMSFGFGFFQECKKKDATRRK